MSVGDWRHAICAECWQRKYQGKPPVVVVDAKAETCCYCGNATNAGIFVREHPEHPSLKGHKK